MTLDPALVRSGARLAELCGLPRDEFLARFARANLLPRKPSGRFPIRQARAAAAAFLDELDPTVTRIVCLGRAAGALGLGTEHFRWEPVGGRGALACRAPHPSGVNRWWNDPANVARAERFFRALAAQVA